MSVKPDRNLFSAPFRKWVEAVSRATLAPGFNVRAKTADYTAVADDCLVTGDATGGAITFTLPQITGTRGKILLFKKLDASANNVTVDGYGAETIDGAATYALTSQYQAVRLIAGPSEWHVF